MLDHLTENQVRLLINKIPYDADIKALFIKKLDSGLYSSHREFLVNPLLTVMMLITLEQFAEVPAKIHLFYEYAFEALFARHDVTKGGFQRKRYVNLAMDDYRRLFSYFCMISYLKEEFRFTESNILEIIDRSIKASQIETKKEDFLEDLARCTCMLVRDGLDYAFSHRSFQEYFSAYFLSRVKSEEFEKAAPRLIDRGRFDNVFLMVFEMNKEKFEECWALPQLQRMVDATYNIDVVENPVDFAIALAGDLKISFMPDSNIRIHFTGNSNTETRSSLYTIYDLFHRINNQLNNKNSKNDKILYKKIYNGEILFDDKRFDKLRKSKSRTIRFEASLSSADNWWIKLTSTYDFLVKEGIELPILFNEVRTRVANRKEGAAAIFDL